MLTLVGLQQIAMNINNMTDMIVDFGLDLPFAFDVDCMVDATVTNSCTFFDEDNFLSSIVQAQKPQDKSPFHESDSGVSEVSDCMSNSPQTQRDSVMLDEMLDNMAVKSFFIETNNCTEQEEQCKILDENCDSYSQSQRYLIEDIHVDDITRYGSQTAAPEKPSSRVYTNYSGDTSDSGTKNLSEVVSSACQVLDKEMSTSKIPFRQSSIIVSDDSDFEIAENGIVNATSCKRKRALKANQPKSQLQSSPVNVEQKLTSVKVIRIVKTGNGTEDDVVKALEERNRKNAEMAKLNRQKKKSYVENLEKDVATGRERIDQLEAQLSAAEKERDSCKREIRYLKSVLMNQSALAGLLKNIPNVSGVTLSSSLTRKREFAEIDHCYTPVKKVCSEPQIPSAGVCLHVDSDTVSLEFCHYCAQMAQDASCL